VTTRIHFGVQQTDIIPGVAAMRAACDIDASGEPIFILANESTRSILAAGPGPCTIVLVLFGLDIGLPVFDKTPLGTHSFSLPGISTVTLGFVDLSVDLTTSLDSTSRVPDGIAQVSPSQIGWSAWGANRILIHGEDGVGSIATSELETTFAYAMSIGFSIYSHGIPLYHLDLVRIGSFTGGPSLVTPLSVDLRPHTLTLVGPMELSDDRATFTWTGIVDSDVDHLELWLTDGRTNVSYRLPANATDVEVTLWRSTHYEARIVSVDGSSQMSPSDAIAFDTPSAGIQIQDDLTSPALSWSMMAVALVAGGIGFRWGAVRARKVR